MSRPIYEPTPARYDAYNDFGNQQLFRRPAPEGATTAPAFFRAYNVFVPRTCGSTGTTQTMVFDFWENCDETVFDVQTTAGNMTTLEILIPGRMILQWGVKFENALSDSFGMSIIEDESVFGPNTHMTVHGRVTNGAQSFESAPAIYVQTLHRSYPVLDLFNSGNQFPIILTFALNQITGSAQDTEFAYLDVTHDTATPCEGPISS